jgi:hypothetical protein
MCSKPRRRSFTTVVAAATLALFLSSQIPAFGAQRPNAVIEWNQVALQCISDTRSGPTITARALAIVHTSMFDASTVYDLSSRPAISFGAVSGRRYTRNEFATAISYAAFRALIGLFPSQVSKLEAEMTKLGLSVSNETDLRTPQGVGNSAAEAVLSARSNDGSNQLGGYADTTGYTPVNTPDTMDNPDRWQPLRVPDGKGGFVVQKFLTPQWALVKPFSPELHSLLQSLRSVPARYDSHSNSYRSQAKQLIDLSAQFTDRDKAIAEYWALGPGSVTPPGRWFEFAQYISSRDHHSLEDDAKLFFILGNSMLDASIAAWTEKRQFDSVRPITAIRYLYAGQPIRAWAGPYQGTQIIDGSNWLPYQAATVVTPGFPEFISGHSTFSAAAAEILRRWTGSDDFGLSFTAPAGSSVIEPEQSPSSDVRLKWETFTQAADQAGFSRRLGGIHFREGDLIGRSVGRSVADADWRYAQHFWQSHSK